MKAALPFVFSNVVISVISSGITKKVLREREREHSVVFTNVYVCSST